MKLYIVAEILNYEVIKDRDLDTTVYAKKGSPENFGVLVCGSSGRTVGIAFQIPFESGRVLNIDTDYKECLAVISNNYDLHLLYGQGVLLGHFSFVLGEPEDVITKCKFDPTFSV